MSHLIDRTGETKRMNNGLNATVIRYGTCQDIDVQFENGQVVYNITYHQFNIESVKCPMIYKEVDDYVVCVNPNSKYQMEFLIDKDDLDKIKDRYWFVTKDKCGRHYYVHGSKQVKLHRYLMNCHDQSVFVDHKNGNGLDNRRCNLRLCSPRENAWNARAGKTNNKYGYIGIKRDKRNKYRQWSAKIRVNDGTLHLGSFETKEQAAQAYNDAAIKYRGDFASINDLTQDNSN